MSDYRDADVFTIDRAEQLECELSIGRDNTDNVIATPVLYLIKASSSKRLDIGLHKYHPKYKHLSFRLKWSVRKHQNQTTRISI